MPLARYAMYAKGVDIWTAPTWDNGDTWVATLRHIAREGRVFVIGVTTVLRGSDVPPDMPGRELWGGEDDGANDGHSAIVGPDGAAARRAARRAGGHPLRRDRCCARTRRALRSSTRSGHYARPDVFTADVDEREAADRSAADGGRSGSGSTDVPGPIGDRRMTSAPLAPSPIAEVRAPAIIRRLTTAYPGAHGRPRPQNPLECCRDDPVGAVHRRDGELGHGDPVREVPLAAGLPRVPEEELRPTSSRPGSSTRRRARSAAPARGSSMSTAARSPTDGGADTLPGVARKTANIVMGNSFGTVVGIAVDTHVRRVSQRLGFTEQTIPTRSSRT